MDNATGIRLPCARWIPLTLLLSSVVFAARPAMAGSEADAICQADLGAPVTADEASSGVLLLETERAGLYVLAPTVRTEVELQVHGMAVRGRVRQTFRNPTAFWVEGKYVFPLPDEAAVDRLRMVIGERLVEGEIQERQQAQRTYAAARREGRKASLVEQQRPNVFTAQVANMGPGEEIVVEIGYLQTLRWVDGGYRLRFPTVVAPRYGGLVAPEVGAGDALGRPRIVLPCEDVAGNGRLAAGEDGTGELELVVELAAGGPLESIESSYHEAVIDLEPGYVYRVRLAATARTDRDFELTWRPRAGADASTRAFVEERDGEFYTLLMIYPPAAAAASALRLPRETVFVIDTSGSMHGESLSQARRALLTALERLRPGDSFNVIQFNSDAHKLFEESVPVGRYSLDEAVDYVQGLKANGGTRIRRALEVALEGPGAGYPVRQIVFITDGAIGNEGEIFDFIRPRLGDSRLFTVGIGSAPNSFFMRQAAELGRGTFTHIGSVEQVDERMSELFRKLESPVLTDLVADWGDPLIEAFPRRVPDLYAGEPLVVIGRAYTPLEGVSLVGKRGAVSWRESVTLPAAGYEIGLAKLWARRKLAKLADDLRASAEPELVRQEAVELALSFHLVSRFTSLVAVDRSPSRPVGEVPVTRAIPLLLPAGWTDPDLISNLPATATNARVWLLLGLAALLAATALARSRKRCRAQT